MSLTAEERAQFELRATLTDAERAVVDSVMEDAHFSAKSRGLVLAFDDRAARFEAAIVRYLLESRKS